ncbi:MAG TPA: hypothetical protein VHE99_11850 [Gammaproteobacteria bacterium]|nr:hypothetical protein [Gammaproteobacteria bacterium]
MTIIDKIQKSPEIMQSAQTLQLIRSGNEAISHHPLDEKIVEKCRVDLEKSLAGLGLTDMMVFIEPEDNKKGRVHIIDTAIINCLCSIAKTPEINSSGTPTPIISLGKSGTGD